jgi:polyisoprenoid-binding protein YceI
MIRQALRGMGWCLAAAQSTWFATAAIAAPESYTIDPTHTFPRWAVSHHGFSIHRGQFNATSGKLTIDWAAKTGSMDIEVETASIGTGDPKFDKVLRSENFFNTEKFPRIRFRGNELRFEGDMPVAASGDLTLLGVTLPVTFRIESAKCGAHPISKRPLCGAEVAGSIKRSAFGMKASLPSIGDDVQLTIQFEAFKD